MVPQQEITVQIRPLPFPALEQLFKSLNKAVLDATTYTTITKLHPFLHKCTAVSIVHHSLFYPELISELIQDHCYSSTMLFIQYIID